ncbi:GGDEF domain-containing protein [Altererythrobacter sp. B11]|uniref:sensor domain-containing diguanylate cyclase n=1 Tax=Altererythrobacter sp. B11 TaxID=2060312 RepID=UPI000DC6EAE2|nr:sensor domain-containing diguanylate cyclase [Altererythrobacter sp. B11]BBC71892.1 GGDEF domain-containing protein [Altererythrobacter sp. B11]
MSTNLACREDDRLTALADYEILDTGAEQPFESITDLVRMTLNVPIATVTFVDGERQWFKARRGVDRSETPRDISLCEHTILTNEALVVPDTCQDARFRDSPLVRGEPHIASYLGIPLVNREGYALGALCAMDNVPRIFPPQQIEIMRKLAELVLDWLEMRRIAQRDFLTGILTRRALLQEAEREVTRFTRYARPGALAIFDIDHFKAINDRFGHPAGDAVLVAVAAACAPVLRAGDALGRLGGEEFGLLLPETGAADALGVAERFRAAIETLRLPDHPGIRVTASFGIAPLQAGCEAAEWLERADRELYRAKHGGRNQCCLAPSGPG